MKTLAASLSLCLALCLSLLVLATAPGCQVQAQDALPYSCATDADCGEDGFTCVAAAGRANFCCQKAAETCNGADDDCDGTVDELEGEPCYEGPEATRDVGACRAGRPACGEGGATTCADQVLPKAAETCNRVDDDCDGAVDEGFALQTDTANCGQCGRACTATQTCILGQCVRRLETSCSDGADNDSDTLIDCKDEECVGSACGEGRACMADTSCGEALCGNGANDDGDANTDCADSDCDGKSCNAAEGGCTCAGTVATETLCGDGQNNDKDANADCADVADCNTKSCGTGCVCAVTGSTGFPKELLCDDGLDNDGREGTDCADRTDCPGGTTCRLPGGGAGRCGTKPQEQGQCV
jgi:hypothetical protein